MGIEIRLLNEPDVYKRQGGNKQVHRSICREMLAIAAPADSGCERFGGKFEAHGATKAAPGSFSHVFVPPSIRFDQTQKLADVERTYRIAPPAPLG